MYEIHPNNKDIFQIVNMFL